MRDGRIRIFFLILADMLALSCCWLGTARVYHAMGGRYEMSTYAAMWPFLLVFVLLAAVMRLYHGSLVSPGMALDPVEEMRRRVYAVLVTYLLLFCYLTFSRRVESFSRVVIVVSAFLDVFFIALARLVVRKLLKWLNIGQIPVLIAGAGKCGRKLEAEIRGDAHFAMFIVWSSRDSRTPLRRPSITGRIPMRGSVSIMGSSCAWCFLFRTIACDDTISPFREKTSRFSSGGNVKFPLKTEEPYRTGRSRDGNGSTVTFSVRTGRTRRSRRGTAPG